MTAPMSKTMNWSKGIDVKGQPIGNPEKEAKVDGVLVSPATGGVTNWFPPSFDPDTGLFYVQTDETFSMFYLTDTAPHPEGWAAAERVWHPLESNCKQSTIRPAKPPGATPAPLRLADDRGTPTIYGNSSNDLIAFDPADGKILWHAGLASGISNGPETYMLDGQQYLVVGAGDSLYAFTIE